MICGESAAVDLTTVDEWKKRLVSIIDSYDPNDVYNADETGLFFKALPNRSLVTAKDTCKGRINADYCTWIRRDNSHGVVELS
ncbi:unnamed protein product [Rotaria sordida]|uniref:Uncharacterized protein n=1 Tax=Rotaria sordida TaxID=392033 RepID=A0A814W5I6_9BILA|nr:unnamed protein product [Rotaria sordida]